MSEKKTSRSLFELLDEEFDREHSRARTLMVDDLAVQVERDRTRKAPRVQVPRPVTREQCRSEMRPCPWVACKHHLYLDINPETGSIKINFPELEPWELPHTCALDVAEQGGITLEEVGRVMNLTRERIRQVEVRGLLKLKMGTDTISDSAIDLAVRLHPPK